MALTSGPYLGLPGLSICLSLPGTDPSIGLGICSADAVGLGVGPLRRSLGTAAQRWAALAP